MTPRALVGCETSGVVRRALAARGLDVWSVDLLPAEDRSNRHIIGDVRDYLNEGWDLVVVAHPPCTRLCRSGRRWLSGPGAMTPPKSLPRGRTWDDLKQEFEEAVYLFVACWRAPAPRVAIENPVMHDIARARMPADLPAPQVVQPFWFGEPAYKATGLYLRGLPPLVATERLAEPARGGQEWRRWSALSLMSPGPDRWKARSRTFEGVAAAMADQWSPLLWREAA